MTTDYPSTAVLRQFRLEAETGPTVLLFAGDARRLLALLDAQRGALEPCRTCAEARKLLGEG